MPDQARLQIFRVTLRSNWLTFFSHFWFTDQRSLMWNKKRPSKGYISFIYSVLQLKNCYTFVKVSCWCWLKIFPGSQHSLAKNTTSIAWLCYVKIVYKVQWSSGIFRAKKADLNIKYKRCCHAEIITLYALLIISGFWWRKTGKVPTLIYIGGLITDMPFALNYT